MHFIWKKKTLKETDRIQWSAFYTDKSKHSSSARGYHVKIKQLSVTCVWQIKGTDQFFAKKSCRQMRDFRRPPVVREMGLAGEGSHPQPDSWGTGKISLFVGFRKWIRCGSFHGILVPLPHPSCPYLFGRKCWILKVKGSFLHYLQVFFLEISQSWVKGCVIVHALR